MKLDRPWLPVLFLALPGVALGCIWDSDTLARELKGKPSLLEVISGRFERNPPEYYEMRLARVTQALTASPDNLNYYDDAGAACDRLHRSAEAIWWMERKRTALVTAAESPEKTNHLYRYHANLGTFMAHQWLGEGAKNETIDQVRQARAHIAKAIEINPSAHFGREKYQLKALDWIIEIRTRTTPYTNSDLDRDPRSFLFFDRTDIPVHMGAKSKLDPEISDAVEGISGLIYLGAAWESVDVFYALQTALQASGDNWLAALAQQRRLELQSQGRRSLFEETKNSPQFRPVNFVKSGPREDAFFKKARVESDSWQKERTRYMIERFKSGLHPDTDADFWKDFRYVTPPP
jgi:tetratricopeptide (TPR) repeat protein